MDGWMDSNAPVPEVRQPRQPRPEHRLECVPALVCQGEVVLEVMFDLLCPQRSGQFSLQLSYENSTTR